MFSARQPTRTRIAFQKHRKTPKRHAAGGLFATGLMLFATLWPNFATANVSQVALYFDRLGAPHKIDAVNELHCLALNVYHEARGEAFSGKLAVAAVTMNRVKSPQFPGSVCEVVWQPGQFSWTRDGRPDKPYENGAWEQSLAVATMAKQNLLLSKVRNATYYHAVQVTPRWARRKQPVARIGKHVFY